jgi:hypothetical protein
MDPEKLNRWLTLVANIGVIAGIIFLGVEIRQNSSMIRAQTRTQLAEEVTELFSVNMNDKDYADVLMRGNNLGELSAVEQYQYFRHRNAWLHYWNNVAYQYRMGMYDEAEFALQMSAIRSDMETFPGLKLHWCENRSRASQGLIEALETDLPGTYCAKPK